ncbi:OmpA family protein [Shewanella sp. Scap07]|uniref:OmpA family protein n=1 Tax=Shewanella sp. Scap07 TaxID=2589987 RepID=UPI0015BD41DC|nr:OmpA family protein [Shewanella sp. Scap07]QLE87547.1 OmpA family protein [Shewanella sp. Scap07]
MASINSILCCILLATFFFAGKVQASTIAYQTPMELSQWQFNGSPYGCEIRHHVDGFGDYVLSAKPGEKIDIALQTDWLALQQHASNISIVNASWQANQPVGQHGTQLQWLGRQASSQHNTAQFVEALELGKTWQTYIQPSADIGYLVKSAPVNTRSVALAFRQCRQQLLPKPFEYVRHVTFNFASAESLLTPTQFSDIEAIAAYIKVDSSIKQVLVDGHADAVGDRLANLVLSKQRADEVSARLVEVGIDSAMIQVRHHGTRAPLASNHHQAGQAKNRRVSVRLIKDSPNPPIAQDTAGVSQ